MFHAANDTSRGSCLTQAIQIQYATMPAAIINAVPIFFVVLIRNLAKLLVAEPVDGLAEPGEGLLEALALLLAAPDMNT